ncbi:MAG: HAD family hydrolase, partial [Cyanobacteria bacterium J06641_5]
MLPLDRAPKTGLADVRLIATDVDGTLTQAECFRPELLAALNALQQGSIPVLLVTGRSAGWVDALRHYLPVVGAIAENGGVFLPGDRADIQVLPAITGEHRQKLAAFFARLQQAFPQLQEATDNAFRLTDWTFDVTRLTAADLTALAARCEAAGWGFTYSTVQCHIKPLGQDKATAISQVLAQAFPHLQVSEVLTIGDSPNDESMFDRARFPWSVGVANLASYRERLTHLPTY